MTERTTTVHLGAWDFNFEMGVCKNITKHFNQALCKKYNCPKETGESNGLCVSYDNKVLLLFAREALTHGLVAHEVSHAVDYIFKYRNIRHGRKGCGETAALAHEYLTNLVHAAFKKFGARIK